MFRKTPLDYTLLKPAIECYNGNIVIIPKRDNLLFFIAKPSMSTPEKPPSLEALVDMLPNFATTTLSFSGKKRGELLRVLSIPIFNNDLNEAMVSIVLLVFIIELRELSKLEETGLSDLEILRNNVLRGLKKRGVLSDDLLEKDYHKLEAVDIEQMFDENPFELEERQEEQDQGHYITSLVNQIMSVLESPKTLRNLEKLIAIVLSNESNRVQNALTEERLESFKNIAIKAELDLDFFFSLIIMLQQIATISGTKQFAQYFDRLIAQTEIEMEKEALRSVKALFVAES